MSKQGKPVVGSRHSRNKWIAGSTPPRATRTSAPLVAHESANEPLESSGRLQAAGKKGERNTQNALGMLPSGFVVFNNVKLPNRARGDVDNIVIHHDSNVVLLVESKFWRPTTYRTDRKGRVWRHPRHGSVEKEGWEPVNDTNHVAHRRMFMDFVKGRSGVMSLMVVWCPWNNRHLMNLTKYSPRGIDLVIEGGKTDVASIVQDMMLFGGDGFPGEPLNEQVFLDLVDLSLIGKQR